MTWRIAATMTRQLHYLLLFHTKAMGSSQNDQVKISRRDQTEVARLGVSWPTDRQALWIPRTVDRVDSLLLPESAAPQASCRQR